MPDTLDFQPDITLLLDAKGVIQKANASQTLAGEGLDVWRGRLLGEMIDPSVGPQVAQMIEEARRSGAASSVKVTQRFPSGLELPIEYTAVSLGKDGGFVAIGRNLQAISDLQSRLLQAQQAREQDYWKIREIETRAYSPVEVEILAECQHSPYSEQPEATLAAIAAFCARWRRILQPPRS